MMPGPIGLLGGLEHYEPTLPIDRRMLDEVGVFAPEVVILPLASFKGQAVAAGALAQAHWASLGARARVSIPASGSDQNALEMVHDADVIVLPGGVPNRLMNALSRNADPRDDHRPVGSGCGGDRIVGRRHRPLRASSQSLSPRSVPVDPGFGLLHGFVVAPHFDRLRVRRWFSPFLKRMGGLAVLGIDESTGLVGTDGVMQVLGTGSVTIATEDSIEVYPTGSIIHIDLGTIPFSPGSSVPIDPRPMPVLAGSAS